jgi:hypothetical protein
VSHAARIRELLEEADYYEGLAMAEHHVNGPSGWSCECWSRAGERLDEAMRLTKTMPTSTAV